MLDIDAAVELFKFFWLQATPDIYPKTTGRRRDSSKRPSSKAANPEEGEAYTGVW
jgi:hypothetical protein